MPALSSSIRRPIVGYPSLFTLAGAATACVLVGFVGTQSLVAAGVIAGLPLAIIVGEKFFATNGIALIVVAMVMNLSGLPFLDQPLIDYPTHIYLSDILVILVCLHSMFGVRSNYVVKKRISLTMQSVTALFLVALAIGTFDGHNVYGTQLIGNSTRLIVYSLFMLAMFNITPAKLERDLRIGFYVGVILSALLGTYYLGTGTSETSQSLLSTGGVRVLGLSVSMYVAGGMLLAMLSIVKSRSFSEAKLDWIILILGAYVQILSLGRTTLVAIAILTPVIMLSSASSRKQATVGVFVAVVLITSFVLVSNARLPAPISTFEQRIVNTNSQESDVQWRARAAEATLSGVKSHLLTGFGFGREPYFSIENTSVKVQGGDPHNGFLYLLAGGGILALASFVAMLAVAMITLVRRLAQAPSEDLTVLWWSGAFLVVYQFNIATGPVISQASFMPTLWILLGIPFAAMRRQ